MLRFLLDEHLSPEIAEQISGRRPEIPIQSMQAFRDGAFLGVDDARVLMAAHDEGWTLVTYDRRTIWPLLQVWALECISHAGVVFVSRGAYTPRDIGGIVRALCHLWDAEGRDDWTGRVVYLQRAAMED